MSGRMAETEQQPWLVLVEVEGPRDHLVIEATDDDTTQPSFRTAQREVLHRRADIDVGVAAASAGRRLVSEVADHGLSGPGSGPAVTTSTYQPARDLER